MKKMYIFASINDADGFLCYVSSTNFIRAYRIAYKNFCKYASIGEDIKLVLKFTPKDKEDIRYRIKLETLE